MITLASYDPTTNTTTFNEEELAKLSPQVRQFLYEHERLHQEAQRKAQREQDWQLLIDNLLSLPALNEQIAYARKLVQADFHVVYDKRMYKWMHKNADAIAAAISAYKELLDTAEFNHGRAYEQSSCPKGLTGAERSGEGCHYPDCNCYDTAEFNRGRAYERALTLEEAKRTT